MKKTLLTIAACVATLGAYAAEYTGLYTTYNDETRECKITIDDNGLYTIQAFYGVEGYDLQFTVNDDNSIKIQNAFYSESGYDCVYTGIDGADYYLMIYTGDGYSELEEEDGAKDVWFYCWLGDDETGGYDEFVWGEISEPAGLDAFAGIYTSAVQCVYVDESYQAEDYEYDDEVEVCVSEDGESLEFINLFMSNWPWTVTGTVNTADQTIDFTDQVDEDGYAFLPYPADGEGGYFTPESMTVTATYEQTEQGIVITIDNWCLAIDYSSYGSNYSWYPFFYNGKMTLTQKEDGIAGVAADLNAPVEYYNLQGMRLQQPAAGQICIVRQGNKVSKVICK